MEQIRIEAGRRMGLGDVAKSVIPKVGLVSEARTGGTFSARYLMPWNCHPTLAVTGSQCLAACALTPGTVAQGLATSIENSPAIVRIEHPSGQMEVTVNFSREDGSFQFRSAGVIRTARLIARGEVLVPSKVWSR
jgi:hypothetical protein